MKLNQTLIYDDEIEADISGGLSDGMEWNV